jgi:hypothetical protein
MKFKALFLAPVMLMALTVCGKKGKTDQQIVDEMASMVTNIVNPVTGSGLEPGSTLRLKNSNYLLGVKTLKYETERKNKDGTPVVAEPEINWTFSNDKWKLQEYTADESYTILKPKMIYKAADEYDTDIKLTMTWNGLTAESTYHVSIYYA